MSFPVGEISWNLILGPPFNLFHQFLWHQWVTNIYQCMLWAFVMAKEWGIDLFQNLISISFFLICILRSNARRTNHPRWADCRTSGRTIGNEGLNRDPVDTKSWSSQCKGRRDTQRPDLRKSLIEASETWDARSFLQQKKCSFSAPTSEFIGSVKCPNNKWGGRSSSIKEGLQSNWAWNEQ